MTAGHGESWAAGSLFHEEDGVRKRGRKEGLGDLP